MTAAGGSFGPPMLERALGGLEGSASAADALARLVAAGADRLALPGGGRTIDRWRALAKVAAHDLSLAKLYEGHTDALAILAELGAADLAAPGSIWGVWAAEAPQGRALIEVDPRDQPTMVRLHGGKCWCSGALGASHALLTAWATDGSAPQLVAIEIGQPAVTVVAGAWRAVGMAGSASLDVRFDGALARLVGGPGDYLRRPGFWHGGAGIAACWYGGAMALAGTLHAALAGAAPPHRSELKLAALGRIDVAMQATAALLRHCAALIDQQPGRDAHDIALRARLAAEDLATLVLHEAGRALGAAPFCRDARFARMAADLPVFIRQSHGGRDEAALGACVADAGSSQAWSL